MDADKFDAVTRTLLGRRSALALLAGGASALLGLDLPAEAKRNNNKKKRKRKKKRCQKNGTCGPTDPCASGSCGPADPCPNGTDCTTGECCCAENVFVRCPDVCLCVGNENFCCAGEPELPPNCPTGPDVAEAFCCPEASICGDFCCDPGWTCVNGTCQCKPENTCGTFCCDPTYFACDSGKGICACILPDPLDCPSGTGGFARVRRIK